MVKRFVLEAKAATKIQSAHVARVLDVGTMRGQRLPPEGLPYMVMEYLKGRDLDGRVALNDDTHARMVDYLARYGA